MGYSDYHQSLDRRKGPRISWINSEIQVVIIPSNMDSKILAWIQDISPGGFKVKAEIPENGKEFFVKWKEIHFETFEDFFQLKGQGRVMWVSSNENMVGIRFSRLNEESRKSFYGFLGMLSVY